MRTTQSKKQLDIALIQDAARMSATEAERQNVEVAIAIVNASGLLSGFIRTPNSFLASIEYAQWKAWTAASFDTPTTDFAGLLESLGSQVSSGLLKHPKVTALPGGLPIRIGGQLVGGIGVSGGNADQDESIAQAGLLAFQT